jgi:penicillin amidase
LIAVALLAVSAVPVAVAGAAGSPQALVVLPPGNGDTVTLSDWAANQAEGGCGGLGPGFCNQLSLYMNWGFRPGPLAASPSEVAGPASTEQPATGVTIVHDGWGVPHVFGAGPDSQTIKERLAYGIGYAQAEDRLFQMEVFRRDAEGQLSDLLGPTYLQMDLLAARDNENAADRAAALAMLTAAQRQVLDAYSAGINAVIARDQNDPSQLPAAFTLLQDLPIRPWSADDTLAIQDLEVRAVSVSSGNEAGFGALARLLAIRYGVKRAVRIFDDVQLTNDPLTPFSVPHDQRARRTTDRLRYDFINYTTADTARQIAALDASVGPARQALLSGQQAKAAAADRLGLPRFGSNAWAIAPRLSATHHALLWGGPQVSYYAPEPLAELEIEGAGFHVRGVGVPGGGPGIVIGYTPHTAWSVTDAQDDQIDTYVDTIRANPDGAGYQYFWRGTWRAVVERSVTIRERTQSPTLPLTGQLPTPHYTTTTVTLYRTFHGPLAGVVPCTVFYLDLGDHRSYCQADAFWNTELQTGLSLYSLDQATNLASFQAAVRGITAGFNFIYADDHGHIAYWHGGRTPVRARGHDPRLPAPGDGRYDWRGYLSPARWPSVLDPAQGFIASWNNKPQASWPASGDGILWGAFQRVRQPMNLLRAHRGRFTLTALWQVAKRAGELDLDDTLGFRPFLTALRSLRLTAIERQAVDQVAAWNGVAYYPDGAERNPDGSLTGKVTAPGYAVFLAWFHALRALAGATVFNPALGPGAVANLVEAFTITPGTTNSEFEFFSSYDAFLYNAMAGRTRGAGYFGPHGSALAQSRAALDQAIGELSASQGSDPSHWRAPMPEITFFSLDLPTIPTIPWENRGTWGQAVALTGPAVQSKASSSNREAGSR